MDKIDQILNDPESIQKIIETASSLGVNNIVQDQQATAIKESELINNILQTSSSRNKKEQALFRALIPFLKPGKQRRLEQAMRIAQISTLAESAFKEHLPLFVEEINHV